MTSTDTRSGARETSKVGVASFAVMVVVGSMYGLTAVLALLPSGGARTAPFSAGLFGAVCAGLTVGTWLSGRLLGEGSPRAIGTAGAAIWALAMTMIGRSLAADVWGLAGAGAVLGGLGVGLTYLTVVAIIGPTFPTRPAAAAAIGPLGFALGTASYCLIGASALTSNSSQADVGNLMAALGGVCLVLSLTGLWLPRKPVVALTRTPRRLGRNDKMLTSGLLFVNALPGMLMLSVAIPLYQRYGSGLDYAQASLILALSMTALLAGGLLSPILRDRLGLKTLFLTLLTLRGVLLVVLPLTSSLPFLILVFAVVLFGHGSGFALLPGVTKQKGGAFDFTRNYGTILVSWGASGVVAVTVTLVGWRVFGGPGVALWMAGGLALLAACLVQVKGTRFFAA